MGVLTCVAYLETAGGPACIASLETARRWNGVDGDYWELADVACNTSDVFYEHRGLLVFDLKYGNFLVFSGKNAFAVAEIVGGEQMPEHTEDMLGVKFDVNAVGCGNKLSQLDCFGGLITVFDSALDGKRLLGDPGAHVIYPFTRGTPNAAVIDVPRGSWDVRDLICDIKYCLLDVQARMIVFECRSGLSAKRRTGRRR